MEFRALYKSDRLFYYFFAAIFVEGIGITVTVELQ